MSKDSLFAVLGDDDYLVRQRAKEIFDELCADFPDDLSREIIDGRADRVGRPSGRGGWPGSKPADRRAKPDVPI